jgi:hypothetical protein
MRFLLLSLTWRLVAVWAFRFSYEVTAETAARTLIATPPRYSTIRELDRKIREFSVSPEMLDLIRGGPGIDPRTVPLPTSMLAYMLGTIQDVGKSLPLPVTIVLRAKQDVFESSCFFIAMPLFKPSSKTPMTRQGTNMHRHLWRLSEPPRTLYKGSRSSFQSSVLWFVASGPYGRIRFLPRYARTELRGVMVPSHWLLGCLRLYCNTRSAFVPGERGYDRA